MKDVRKAIIGCGNLGLSIVNGLLKDEKIHNATITATRRNISPIKFLEAKGVRVTSDNKSAVEGAELIIIAVKPYNLKDVLEDIRPVLQPRRHIIVSTATVVTTDEIYQTLGMEVPILRAMPNTAAGVRESATCICHRGATTEQVEMVASVFNQVGITIEIKEELMGAATILGACGIAYALRFIRGMIQGGIQIGFDAETAKTIVTHTVKGASDLLIANNEHPEREIDKVTTPRGCTIVGLNEMEHGGFSSSLIKGIVASFKEIDK